jgi:hypothetical protein
MSDSNFNWKPWVTVGVIVVLVLGMMMWAMGIYNTEVSLRNRYLAQKKTIETAHDKMWKTLKQQFKINTKYEETFKAGLLAVAEGRKGGSLFKSSSESSSQLGLSDEIYTKMMNSIDGQRAMLKRHQDVYADIWRQHKTHCEKMPNNFFVGGKVLEEPSMISSTATKNAIETGVDDDISLD